MCVQCISISRCSLSLMWLLLLSYSRLFQGLTPLHLAAQSGYDNAIEQLIIEFSKCVCGCVRL